MGSSWELYLLNNTLMSCSWFNCYILFQATTDFCDQWKKRHPTTVQIWHDSSHVQHLRFHPSDYKSLLSETLKDSLNVAASARDQPIPINSKLWWFSSNFLWVDCSTCITHLLLTLFSQLLCSIFFVCWMHGIQEFYTSGNYPRQYR